MILRNGKWYADPFCPCPIDPHIAAVISPAEHAQLSDLFAPVAWLRLPGGPLAETVFWKKPGAGPSGKKGGVLSGQLGPKGSENAPAFLPEGAEIGFLCCPVWQGKLLKTQIITFADR